MKRCDGITASIFLSGARVYINIVILSLFLLCPVGYTAADVADDSGRDSRNQDQIKKDAAAEWSNRTRFGGDMRLRSGNDRASRNNVRTAQSVAPVSVNSEEQSSACSGDVHDKTCSNGAPEQGIPALVEILKKKKIISTAEADRITRQYMIRPKGTDEDAEGIAALAALLESKKIINQDEAARFTSQYAGRNAGTNVHAQIDKEEIRKDIREQVAKQVHLELYGDKAQHAGLSQNSDVEPQESPSGEAKIAEVATDGRVPVQKRIDDIDQNVSYLQQKVAELLYGGKVGELANQSMPEWMRRFSFSGDLRLRYEYDKFSKNNDSSLPVISQGSIPDFNAAENTTVNQYHFKYRVRLAVTAKVDDQLDAVVRLSTGNTTNPVSTNSLFGNVMNKDNLLIEQAYMKWKPDHNITLYGGRMPNPWFHSDLVWDPDLNFEGLALNLRYPLAESQTWTPFLTLGAFPLQQASDINFTQHGKWLYAGQAGVERKDLTGISGKFGAAYYVFKNISGVLNPDPATNPGATNWSSPLFTQNDFARGNSLFFIDPGNSTQIGLASQFRELDITGSLDIGYWDPIHIVLLGDYVNNLGFNLAKVNALRAASGLASVGSGNIGYQAGLSVGYPKIEAFGQWKGSLYYKYLGADAVVDAFTDSDFHLGGTNAKGWILGADFGLMKNTWLSAKWFSADQISGSRLAIDVLFIDLNARF